ncbi:MAG TPA: hypothetical protein VNZ22_14540 [Bacillota bacterium]|nr:hypothetical protein [Bacillota bacterium]
MSAVCIIAPVVIAGWPAFSAAVMAAAASLGYQVAAETAQEVRASTTSQTTAVELEIARSEVVTQQLGRDQRISVTREGVTVTFARDARGKATLCVTGHGHSEEALRALGEELSHAVVQQYVYQRLLDEMRARGFVVAEEETTNDRAIHLKVRHWES